MCISIRQVVRRRDRADQTFGAIPFVEVIKMTPDDLKQRPNGLYVSIAVPWCDEPHQQVSCRLLLRLLECGPSSDTRQAFVCQRPTVDLSREPFFASKQIALHVPLAPVRVASVRMSPSIAL